MSTHEEEPIYNVLVTIVDLVPASSEEEAIARLTKALDKAGFDVFDDCDDWEPSAVESRLRRLLRHVPIVKRHMRLPRRKTIYESPVKDVEPGADALTISWSVSGFTYARGNVSPGSITGVGTVAPTGVDDENPDV